MPVKRVLVGSALSFLVVVKTLEKLFNLCCCANNWVFAEILAVLGRTCDFVVDAAWWRSNLTASVRPSVVNGDLSANSCVKVHVNILHARRLLLWTVEQFHFHSLYVWIHYLFLAWVWVNLLVRSWDELALLVRRRGLLLFFDEVVKHLLDFGCIRKLVLLRHEMLVFSSLACWVRERRLLVSRSTGALHFSRLATSCWLLVRVKAFNRAWD